MKQYSIWAHNTDPAWIAGNAGVPDMVIVSAETIDEAHFAAQRIRCIAPEVGIEIRDTTDRVVTVREIPRPYSNPAVEIVSVGERPAHANRPKRRTLGTREN